MTRRTLLYLGGGLLALALSTGGFFWYQHYQAVKNVEPIKIYKVTQPRQVSETPSLQGEVSVPVQHAETSKAGHWHGDEWHAEPHTEPAASDAQAPDEQLRQADALRDLPDTLSEGQIDARKRVAEARALQAEIKALRENPLPPEEQMRAIDKLDVRLNAQIDENERNAARIKAEKEKAEGGAK